MRRKSRQLHRIQGAKRKPVEPLEWYRHYSASTAYCNGREKQFYAVTFDTDANDKSGELFNSLIETTINRCGNSEPTGYAVDATEEGRNSANTYPSIEIGAL